MYYRRISMTTAILVALMAMTGVSARPTPQLNFSQGFANTTGLQLNGTAAVLESNVCLTIGSEQGQAGGVFSTAAVPVGKFRTSFQFLLDGGDGITFTLQGTGSSALGNGGSGLGYTGIGPSVAVKFDRFNNEAQAFQDLTGLYTDGEEPSGGPTEVSVFPVSLLGAGVVTVNMTYNGKNLSVKISDMDGERSSQTYAIDIPGELGASTALVGFTGATGLFTGNQCILSWTYTGQ